MKHEPKICRNCAYKEDLNELKKWCIYWKGAIGPSRAMVGCSKFVSMKELLEKIPMMDENDIKKILEDKDEEYWENITGL